MEVNGPRLDVGKTVTRWGLAVNLFMTVLRFIVGVVSGSTAVLADALDSFSDTLMSLILWCGFKFAGKDPDPEHPLGHGDMEPLAGLFASLLLCVLGFEMAHISYDRMVGGTGPPQVLAIYVTLFTAVVKLGLYRYVSRVEGAIESPALKAFAANFKGDLYSTLVVLAGVVGARSGIPILDPMAGFIISAYVVWIGVRVGRENVLQLMGTVPAPELETVIRDISISVEGVVHVHNIHIHSVGATVAVAMHICVDRDISITDAHDIATEVQDRVRDGCQHVTYVLVHPEPYDMHHRERYG